MPRTSRAEATVPMTDHTLALTETQRRELAAKLIQFLETGAAPDGLFTADAFCDFTMPQWRLQAQGAEDIRVRISAQQSRPARARSCTGACDL